MLEQSLQELFERMATAEQPQQRVSIDQAARRGRVRLRRRRAGAAASAALAVSVALAVAFAVATPASRPIAPPTRHATPAHYPTQPPWPAGRPFDPDVPYAAFGWLPAGSTVTGMADTKLVYLRAYNKDGDNYVALNVYPPRQCTLAHQHLNCEANGGAATDRAPDINGHLAYWISGTGYGHQLAFNYAPGGWAFLGYFLPYGHPDRALAVKIARQVRFGATTRVRFAARLTHMPADWQPYSVSYSVTAGGDQATFYDVAPITRNKATGDWQYPLDTPELGVAPASRTSTCLIPPAGKNQGTHEVINGYHVIVVDDSGGAGHAPFWYLCSTDADGLNVFIGEEGARPAYTVTDLFARHFTLLGPDPARWTTRPVS
jgi:hypothetical protein